VHTAWSQRERVFKLADRLVIMSGLGFLKVFKSETAQVVAGTSLIGIAGFMVGGVWFSSISDKLPRTFSTQWKAATEKYRLAQNQDPISRSA